MTEAAVGDELSDAHLLRRGLTVVFVVLRAVLLLVGARSERPWLSVVPCNLQGCCAALLIISSTSLMHPCPPTSSAPPPATRTPTTAKRSTATTSSPPSAGGAASTRMSAAGNRRCARDRCPRFCSQALSFLILTCSARR